MNAREGIKTSVSVLQGYWAHHRGRLKTMNAREGIKTNYFYDLFRMADSDR